MATLIIIAVLAYIVGKFGVAKVIARVIGAFVSTKSKVKDLLVDGGEDDKHQVDDNKQEK